MNKFVWLIDAAALTAEEIASVRKLKSHLFVYEHLNDEQAEVVGPLLIAADEAAQTVIDQLMSEPNRLWAISQWVVACTWAEIASHAKQLRYLHTRDGLRYYLRFADGRSWPFVWQVLSDQQKARVMGPITTWQYHDRAGTPIQLEAAPRETKGPSTVPPRSSLVLSDSQLSKLLELIWPDQLLAGVLDDNPAYRSEIQPLHAYELSLQACQWFDRVGESRFDVQKRYLEHLIQAGTNPSDARAVHACLDARCAEMKAQG